MIKKDETYDPIVTVVGNNGVEFPCRMSLYESYKSAGLKLVAKKIEPEVKPKPKVVRKKRTPPKKKPLVKKES